MRHLLLLVLILSGTSVYGSPRPPEGEIAAIVFTQLPVQEKVQPSSDRTDRMLPSSYGEKGRIVRLLEDGRPVVLTRGFHSAADPEISFDGQRILFAAKRKSQDYWNIFEMNADGSEARQVTQNLRNCRSPMYQSAFYTIDSSQPWYQISFVSDAAGETNEFDDEASTSLYSCRPDGSGVERLTYNPSSDRDPFLMNDGRILYAAWQRSTLSHGHRGRISLFGLNLDGTDLALFAGDQGCQIKLMPTVTADRLAVFVESESARWDGAGHLASVSLRRPYYSYKGITKESSGLFHSPSPLPDGRLLVSRRPADGGGTHAIYSLDPSNGQMELVYDSPRHHDVQAKIHGPRPEPDGRSSIVNEKDPYGQLYCLNVYQSNRIKPEWLPRGSVKRIRVLEGVPGTTSQEGERKSSFIPVEPLLLKKRLLGEIPVEDDGSFFIQVPANIPVQLQTLDERGMALQTCSWIWTRNHEPRGCIGCHEDPELTPENRLVSAVEKPAIRLTLPPHRRRVVDFRRDVSPIISAKCVSCHAVGGAQPELIPSTPEIPSSGEPDDPWRGVYKRLLGKLEGGRGLADPEDYIRPGEARRSPLIWHLFGTNTSRPWDRSGETPKMDVADHLDDDERRVFVEWIDMGALWDGIPGEQE